MMQKRQETEVTKLSQNNLFLFTGCMLVLLAEKNDMSCDSQDVDSNLTIDK